MSPRLRDGKSLVQGHPALKEVGGPDLELGKGVGGWRQVPRGQKVTRGRHSPAASLGADPLLRGAPRGGRWGGDGPRVCHGVNSGW